MTLSPEIHRAADVVAWLQLEPLPQEGGWFRRTLEGTVPVSGGLRPWSVIYALITPEGFSALHRVAKDEVWCFHAGDPLESLRLESDGRGEQVIMGLGLEAGQRPQDVVRAGIWQGTRLAPGGRWALVSCIVAPEFRWEDFELARRDKLRREWPEWSREIEALTRA